MLDFLISFFTDYGYMAVFGILILCGFGLPVPEDITLVSGGVIAGLDLANPHTMVIVGLAGVLIGDSTMFIAGRVFGYRIQRIRTFRKILSPRRFSHIQRKFKQYGLSLLFIARFLPGLRSPIFLVAGMSRRIPYLTFVLIDGFAAIISVPVWVYLGYFFADNLDLLMQYVKDVQTMIYAALFLVFAVVLIIYLKKRFHSKMSKFSDDSNCNCEPTTPITREQAAKIVKGESLCEFTGQEAAKQAAKQDSTTSTQSADKGAASEDELEHKEADKVEKNFASIGTPKKVQLNKKPN
ncbi:MAG: DedA family protein [Anaerobiospirillum succiniciproducens]|uniref:DedA family protein n=1 Tax=Anaerobiospirillum succiniciproducens TaxID=13335 RepID=UPI0026DC8CF0|nr:DedA family protein [Anaerobiospirillum succiniciproducens]MDO4675435.1 DedA family protein [Anaerobiospirillum succiniciproducens]